MLNILNEPVIRADASGDSRVEASLPEVYAMLMADEVDAFPALRPHQRHAWHAFLVQLGGMAMHQDGLDEPPKDATEWLRIIRALTPDYPDAEPWQLVVDDLTKPAFMQPPASSADHEKDYKSSVATPDELDMLVTSKNHDLKAAVATQAAPDEWLFALITLQTMEGFSGQGNYGISRMNGGYGSRPAFTLTPSERPGAHVRRDIIALMDDISMTDSGIGILWTISWDGAKTEKLPLNQLASHYIEICRRIRLRFGADGHLSGVRATSKAERIEAKDLKGRTGDPWTPINQKEGKALTLTAAGFTYKQVTDYLTSADWERPVLLKPTQSEQRSSATMQLVARAMVRGQGKTEGYHERIIPIRNKAKTAMLRRNSTQELGDIAQERIGQIRIVQHILRHAIATFAARGEGNNTSSEQRTLAHPWSDKLDEVVDRSFFDDLQTEFESDDQDERQHLRNEWLLNSVVKEARRILRDATDALPCPAIHRYRARVNAEGLFEGRIRGAKGLPFLFDGGQKEN